VKIRNKNLKEEMALGGEFADEVAIYHESEEMTQNPESALDIPVKCLEPKQARQ
jgi:hypothetical protein